MLKAAWASVSAGATAARATLNSPAPGRVGGHGVDGETGRLDQLLHVPLPTVEDRHAILTALAARIPTAADVDKAAVAAATVNLTGADLEALYR